MVGGLRVKVERAPGATSSHEVVQILSSTRNRKHGVIYTLRRVLEQVNSFSPLLQRDEIFDMHAHLAHIRSCPAKQESIRTFTRFARVFRIRDVGKQSVVPKQSVVGRRSAFQHHDSGGKAPSRLSC